MIALTRGAYEVGEALHTGPLAKCFRVVAQKSALGRPLRLKQLRPQFNSDAALTQRWLENAERNAALPPGASASVVDWGQTPQGAFLVVEEHPGVSLLRMLQGLEEASPLPQAFAVRVVSGVLDAFSVGHAESLAHLDVQPASILVEEGERVTLTEFGAWSSMEGRQHSLHRVSMGHVHYCAPEVVTKLPPYDARSDVFSAGVLLFRLLTGKRPYGGVNQIQVVMAIAQGSRAPTEDVAPELSADLCAVLDGMLALDPNERFQTARAALTALRSATGSSGPSATGTELGGPAVPSPSFDGTRAASQSATRQHQRH
jgi:eukaryotic-like serine/threonine-protein kinase